MFQRGKQGQIEIFGQVKGGLSHSSPGKGSDLSSAYHAPDTVHMLLYLFSPYIHEVKDCFP